jgi:hypothetical protein
VISFVAVNDWASAAFRSEKVFSRVPSANDPQPLEIRQSHSTVTVPEIGLRWG